MTHFIGGERVEDPSGAAAKIACRHGISEARVQAWWEREERRQPQRNLGACGCCVGPCGIEAQFCRWCEPVYTTGGELL